MGIDLTEGKKEPGPPIYAIELREQATGADVAIIRIPREEDAGTLFADVWTNRFATIEAARSVMAVMMGRPDQWCLWARMAQILGADFLSGVIEAEIIEAARLAEEGEREARKDAERLAKQARKASVVQLLLMEKGVPRVIGRRGDQNFLTLTLDTVIEARRVWDWVRWQTEAFQDWFVLAEVEGSIALERLILQSMLAEERRVKAAGLSAGGRRPLRYWRPEDPSAREGEEGDRGE